MPASNFLNQKANKTCFLYFDHILTQIEIEVVAVTEKLQLKEKNYCMVDVIQQVDTFEEKRRRKKSPNNSHI